MSKPLPTIQRRLLSIDEAAAYLSVGRRTMQTLLAEGDVPKVRIKARTLVDQSDLDEFVERTKAES